MNFTVHRKLRFYMQALSRTWIIDIESEFHADGIAGLEAISVTLVMGRILIG